MKYLLTLLLTTSLYSGICTLEVTQLSTKTVTTYCVDNTVWKAISTHNNGKATQVKKVTPHGLSSIHCKEQSCLNPHPHPQK